MQITKWYWLIVGFFLGIVVGVGGLTLMNQVQPAAIVIQPPPPPPLPEPTATPGPVRVYVHGRVMTPDVYWLPPGSLVQAAVAAAGGFAEGADTALVNLAQPLQDGMQIYVPAEGEVVNRPAGGTEMSSGTMGAGPDTAVAGINGALININTATADELDALPGIGPSTAQKIVVHRETNGPFATIEAIMDVPGIGPAKFEAISALITVGN